jgi:hypothetical protein
MKIKKNTFSTLILQFLVNAHSVVRYGKSKKSTPPTVHTFTVWQSQELFSFLIFGIKIGGGTIKPYEVINRH